MKTYESAELRELYEEKTALAIADCEFVSDLVGGQPATEKGVRAFCEHHLHLAGDDLELAIKRIMDQEVGERDTTGGGEVKEVESYGVNVLRHDTDGCCWLGDWQIKACLKQSASRLGIFVNKKGSKGDMAEMGEVRARGISLGEIPRRVRIMGPDGNPYLGNVFEKFMGRVSTPQGAKSIVHDSEIAPPGCRFSFEFRYAAGKIKDEDMARVIACAQILGLGSAKALERGKFKVNKLTIYDEIGVATKNVETKKKSA